MQLLNIILTPSEIRALTKAIVTYAGVITAQRDMGMASREEVNAEINTLNDVIKNMNDVAGAALNYYEGLREEQEDR